VQVGACVVLRDRDAVMIGSRVVLRGPRSAGPEEGSTAAGVRRPGGRDGEDQRAPGS
jgi:hypothetical protein